MSLCPAHLETESRKGHLVRTRALSSVPGPEFLLPPCDCGSPSLPRATPRRTLAGQAPPSAYLVGPLPAASGTFRAPRFCLGSEQFQKKGCGDASRTAWLCPRAAAPARGPPGQGSAKATGWGARSSPRYPGDFPRDVTLMYPRAGNPTSRLLCEETLGDLTCEDTHTSP